MKNETFLDIAKRDLKQAQLLYRYRSDDEGDLNNIGYLLQQSIEKSLKYYLEINGVAYPKSHDIDDLLSAMPNGEFSDLEDSAAMITQMEDKTRYIKNYRLSLRKIEKVMQIAVDVIKRLDIVDDGEKTSGSKEPFYMQIFPTYDDVITMPSGWIDTSDAEDEVPSFSITINNTTYKLFIDYKAQQLRHPPKSVRYILMKNGEFFSAGNKYDEIMSKVK